MGHAHHFLSRLDRVSHDEVEFSLGLYNNAPLVKYILARSGLPDAAERVAISLDDRNEGPFLVVTREGRFVTCLARGMHIDIPVVRRWQLDLLADRHQELKAAMRPTDDVPEAESAVRKVFDGVYSCGPNLSREAFLDLAPLQPMMFFRYAERVRTLDDWLNLAAHNLRRVDRPRACDHDLLERYWNRLWALRHLLLLMGVGDPIEYFEELPRETLEKINGSSGVVGGWHVAFPMAVAGAWSTARFGRAYMPIAGHGFERSLCHAHFHQSALELAAIAGAHPEQREVILHAFKRVGARPANDEPISEDYTDRIDIAARVARAFTHTEDLDLRAALHGAERLFAAKHPVIDRRGWRSVRDVPVDVAMPYAASPMIGWVGTDATLDALYDLTPSFARYRPEDFYYPARWLRELRVAWTPELTMAHLRLRREYYISPKPKVVAKTPGRNDACSCGSGAKYKKCCAVVKKPEEVVEEAVERKPSLADGIMPRARKTPVRDSMVPPAQSPGEVEERGEEDVGERPSGEVSIADIAREVAA